MEHRSPNPRGQRESYPPRDDYQRPRGRREEPPRREAYQPYRQEPPPDPRFALDDVLAEITTLQQTVADLAANQPAKNEILGAVHDLEGSFRQKLSEYYPADVIDSKLAEQAGILQTARNELEEIRAKTYAPSQGHAALATSFIQHFWSTWQARVVLASNIILAGIFGVDVIIVLLQMAFKK